MKSGYDQFFKQARKSVEKDPELFKKARAQKSTQQNHSAPAKPAISFTTKKAQARKNRKSTAHLIVMSGVGVVACLLGLIFYQEVETFVKKVEINLLGSANAEEAKPAAEEKKSAGGHEAESKAAAAKKELRDTSQDDHFSKLQDRKKELDIREEELKRVEVEIQAQKAEIEKKLKDLENMRLEISNLLQERMKSDSTKVDTLVQVYTNMKPQQAAKIFETLDEDLAIEILGRMKKKSAADIMNLLKAEKAQAFSERFAGYRLPASK